MKHWKLTLILITVAIGGGFGLCKIFCQTNFDTPTAKIKFYSGFRPLEIVLIVRTPTNTPKVNSEVRVWNNSGFQSTYTDTNGIAILSLGERDISKIEVNGTVIYESKSLMWKRPPTLDSGLLALVVEK